MAFIQFISAANHTLRALNLSNNLFTEYGVKKSLILMSWDELMHLNVSHNRICQNGFNYIINKLSNNRRQLLYLDFSSYSITISNAVVLAQYIVKLSASEECIINLLGNTILNEVAKDILNALIIRNKNNLHIPVIMISNRSPILEIQPSLKQQIDGLVCNIKPYDLPSEGEIEDCHRMFYDVEKLIFTSASPDELACHFKNIEKLGTDALLDFTNGQCAQLNLDHLLRVWYESYFR
jgi:hypothetical protein